MANTTPIPPVLPCSSFNQNSCLSANCGFSHLPDSFSLGSGGRNVCLLFLIRRCDGWGCSYSHSRDELVWGDEQIKNLIHQRLQLIDAYNGRMSRNPYPIQSFAPAINSTADWIHAAAAPLPYATPSASGTIDSATIEAAILNDTQAVQEPSNADIFVLKTDDEVVESVPAPSPDLVQDVTQQNTNDVEEVYQHFSDSETPHAAPLNPLAPSFIPFGYPSVETEEPFLPEPLTEGYEEPLEPEESASTHGWYTPVTAVDQDFSTVIEEKVASKRDIDTWGAAPGDIDAWDLKPAKAADPVPADDWKLSTTGSGRWDAPPDDDAFKTPPNTATPLGPKKVREPPKKKGKPQPAWREEKASQDTSGSQKPKWDSKRPEKFDKSSRKHERRQSVPSTAHAAKQDRRRSIVTVSHEETGASSSVSWRDVAPHQTSEVAIEEQAKKYKVKLEPGSILPHEDTMAEIVKANFLANAQLARGKVATARESPPIETSSEVDLGIRWVNGGPSRLSTPPDPPREFSQRSGATKSTWGQKNLPPLSE